jgi:hypothetical protein
MNKKILSILKEAFFARTESSIFTPESGGFATDIAYHPKTKTTAITREDGKITLFSPEFSTPLTVTISEDNDIHCSIFNFDGSLLALGLDCGKVVIYNSKNGEQTVFMLSSKDGYSSEITNLSFTFEDSLLATTLKDGVFQVNTKTGTTNQIFSLPTNSTRFHCASPLSTNSTMIAIATNEGIYIIDTTLEIPLQKHITQTVNNKTLDFRHVHYIDKNTVYCCGDGSDFGFFGTTNPKTGDFRFKTIPDSNYAHSFSLIPETTCHAVLAFDEDHLALVSFSKSPSIIQTITKDTTAIHVIDQKTLVIGSQQEDGHPIYQQLPLATLFLK